MSARTITCVAGCIILAGVFIVAAQPESLGSREMLFTTPTINDVIPSALALGPLTSSAVVMHEDDWRQFEFVASQFRPQIEEELRNINAIWAKHSVSLAQGTAFRKVHVRALIPAPLSISLSRAELSLLFGRQPVPFAFHGRPSPLRDVQAVRYGGLTFYSEIIGGRLRVLGLDLDAKPPLPDDVAARLEKFVRSNALLLVHWPSRTTFASPDAAVRYLRGQGG